MQHKWDNATPVDHGESHAESLDDTVKRLAGLSEDEYEQRRRSEAKRLGVHATYLDRRVTAARPRDDDNDDLELFDPELWDDPVAGDDLLDRIVAEIKRYVVVPEAVAEAAALWAVHTHCFDYWQVTPRFAISAPTMESGKSIMLDVMACLVPRALEADNLSTAVLFRAVDKYGPTLMIDEVDSFLKDNEELRGALNSGHRKGAKAWRCEGDNNDLKGFRIFAPVATAGIGRLAGTLADRSIHARLFKKKAEEHIEGFRSDRTKKLRDLACQAARFVADSEAMLRNAEPDMPAGIFNRKADNWRPLLAIADAAGGDWPARARRAAVALSARVGDDVNSLGELLITDIRTAFNSSAVNQISTANLIDELVKLDERPWSEYRHGRPITAR
jgi:putative DNA primase/helicase|tara:strand:- start:192 stop:1355 length:1164 start_codon:yes stop_codon:yes gene_type:complete